MEKGALLLASYGTTRDSACSRGLYVLERELAEAFPQCELVTAFTSQKVRRALEAYKGTLLLVSHEPEFYEEWVDSVWNIERWTTKIV